MFSKDLLIMVDFVASKSLEEMEFDHIPIWIRVFKLPLGMMCRLTCVAIRDQVRHTLEVEVEEDGMAGVST